MPLKLNNSNDGYFTSVFLLNNNTSDWDEVRDLINAQGGGGGVVSSATLPLSISNGVLDIDLTAYSSTSQINSLLTNYITNTVLSITLSNALSGYTDTTNLNTLLAAKQNTLSAGNGITINNNTISGLTLQLDGVAQSVSTLNFIQNNALTSSGVLNISRLTHYDKIPLIYSNVASIKDLEQDVNGYLTWNGGRVAMRTETFTQINNVLPLTGTVSGTQLTLESLWKPSAVSYSGGLIGVASDSLGTLDLSLYVNTPLFIDSTFRLSCDLSSKQDLLTASEGIYINQTTISSYRLRYQQTGLNQSTPSSNVQTINFKDFSISESINLNSEYQLEVALPTQLRALQNGPSAISLGTNAAGTATRIAVYEASNSAFFYGLSLFEGQPSNLGVGVGIWGGTLSGALPDCTGAGTQGTQLPDILLTRNQKVGIQNANPAEALDVIGNLKVSGSGAGNGVFSGTCTAQSFPLSSDQSIKDNISKADYSEIQNIFDAIDVKTYTRNDGVEGSRIGFIANDFDNNISEESQFQNIVFKIKTEQQTKTTEGQAGEAVEEVVEEQPYILGIDYSRLCTILWGVCKNQEARIEALEAKIT